LDRLLEYDPVVGVDIAPDYIRATQLERVGGEYYLRNIGMVETPHESFEGGMIVRPTAVAEALRELFRERRFETKKVVTAVRGKGVVSRIITLPSMPQERLRRLIENEVNRYIVFSEDDKVVYYHPIEEFDEHDRRKVNIMLVVARKSLCMSYCETFKRANLELTGIDFGMFGIMRELRNSMPYSLTGNTMSVISDSQSVSMNIFSGDTLKFTRTTNVGKEDLAGGNGQVDRVVGEMLLALNYYQTEHPQGDMIQKLVVSAGATGDKLVAAVRESVDEIPVETHSPFANIRLNVEDFPASVMERVDSDFAASVGLALHGQELDILPFQVDLLPSEVHHGKLIASQLKTFVRWALVALIVIFGPYVYLKESQQKSLNNRIASLTAEQDELTGLMSRQAASREQQRKLNPLSAETPAAANLSPLFEEVKRVIPKTAQLTAMRVVAPNVVEFEGIAEDNPSIFYFKSSLASSEMFEEVELGPRSMIRAHGRGMVGFVIRCRHRGLM